MIKKLPLLIGDWPCSARALNVSLSSLKSTKYKILINSHKFVDI